MTIRPKSFKQMVFAAALLYGGGPVAAAQHTDGTAQLAAHALPQVTRATPTAARQHITEAYLSQLAAMGSASLFAGRIEAMTMLNLEGLTLGRGELTTGGYGEGYVDRRHPHTYLHEATLTVRTRSTATQGLSLTGGRGFATFGSDDPMVRPFAKYPVNHHLAQILERGILVAAARAAGVTVEASLFNGDEPTTPSDLPTWSRFGDSWAARLTWAPRPELEVSGSHAFVASPEVAAGGGVNHIKWHTGARWEDPARYALVEWARTISREDEVTGEHFDSFLAEGAFTRRAVTAAFRLERTDRHEEERLGDPFRVAVPPNDVNLLAVTQWSTVTLSVSGKLSGWRGLQLAPFAEAAVIGVGRRGGGVFEPQDFYGSTRLYMLSAGARITAGSWHQRMGRYGVAAAHAAPSTGTHPGPHH